jgi:hypothetical protein
MANPRPTFACQYGNHNECPGYFLDYHAPTDKIAEENCGCECHWNPDKDTD